MPMELCQFVYGCRPTFPNPPPFSFQVSLPLPCSPPFLHTSHLTFKNHQSHHHFPTNFEPGVFFRVVLILKYKRKRKKKKEKRNWQICGWVRGVLKKKRGGGSQYGSKKRDHPPAHSFPISTPQPKTPSSLLPPRSPPGMKENAKGAVSDWFHSGKGGGDWTLGMIMIMRGRGEKKGEEGRGRSLIWIFLFFGGKALWGINQTSKVTTEHCKSQSSKIA